MQYNRVKRYPPRKLDVARGEVKKVAFTLAEVLITLGIIGVVAAMTIPTLMQNYQKKVFATRVHQAFNILSQTVEMAKSDYGDVSSWDFNADKGKVCDSYYNCVSVASKAYAEKYFIPYLKSNNLGNTSLLKLNHPGIRKRNGDIYLDVYANEYYTIQLSNGVLVMFVFNGAGTFDDDGNFQYFTLSVPYIIVDVNGAAKPNIKGRDVFMFEFSLGKNALITNSNCPSTSKELYNTCSEVSANCCSKCLQVNNWQMDKNYPW